MEEEEENAVEEEEEEEEGYKIGLVSDGGLHYPSVTVPDGMYGFLSIHPSTLNANGFPVQGSSSVMHVST